MKIHPVCPICGSHDLIDFNGRKSARCSGCHSMERTRASWALMERYGVIKKGLSVLHFAPEVGLSRRLKDLGGDYVSADYEISQYAGFLPHTVKVDLCDLSDEPFVDRFDLIVHNHVLEHVFCDVGSVLKRLVEFLKPNGSMYFSIPIRQGVRTTENLDPSLSSQERKKLFGQHDHVRFFGENDVADIMRAALGPNLDVIQPEAVLTDAEMKLFAIPRHGRISGDTIFVYRNGFKQVESDRAPSGPRRSRK